MMAATSACIFPTLTIEGFRGIDKLTIPRLALQDEADACSASGN